MNLAKDSISEVKNKIKRKEMLTKRTEIKKQQCTAEYAVSTVMRRYAAQFLKIADRYMSERVKDVYDTFDMPTEYGSPIHEGHRPRTDAASRPRTIRTARTWKRFGLAARSRTRWVRARALRRRPARPSSPSLPS